MAVFLWFDLDIGALEEKKLRFFRAQFSDLMKFTWQPEGKKHILPLIFST